MKWTSICKLAGLHCLSGADPDVSAVSEDSRKVKAGYVFVATPGTKADGHEYAELAVAQGAVAIVGARENTETLHGVPYGFSHTPRRAVALIAQALHGNPSRDLTLIGVTGTNGKSSVAALTQSILLHSGNKCANFGTLGYDLVDTKLDAALTTPNAETLAGLFAKARDAQCTHVVMEASSHALEQDRVAALEFDVAAMTNLTQDHLDYHQDMAQYRDAKLKLFAMAGKFAVANTDDASAGDFLNASNAQHITYAIADENAQVRAKDITLGFAETIFKLLTPWGNSEAKLKVLGRHSVYNALCAAAICGALGVEISGIVRGLEALPSVPGRFEPVFAGQNFHVVVDYAHTDDALLNTLQSARQLCAKRIILVFGCGGDRDKGKRPKMGAVAAQHADTVVITSDNPRTEDPKQILSEVEAGVKVNAKTLDGNYCVIEDRKAAIHFAIETAREGDLVLIAGKGHEDYQILGDQRIHFDDRECAREILEGRCA